MLSIQNVSNDASKDENISKPERDLLFKTIEDTNYEVILFYYIINGKIY